VRAVGRPHDPAGSAQPQGATPVSAPSFICQLRTRLGGIGRTRRRCPEAMRSQTIGSAWAFLPTTPAWPGKRAHTHPLIALSSLLRLTDRRSATRKHATAARTIRNGSAPVRWKMPAIAPCNSAVSCRLADGALRLLVGLGVAHVCCACLLRDSRKDADRKQRRCDPAHVRLLHAWLEPSVPAALHMGRRKTPCRQSRASVMRRRFRDQPKRPVM
jgi:hypothetical protein